MLEGFRQALVQMNYYKESNLVFFLVNRFVAPTILVSLYNYQRTDCDDTVISQSNLRGVTEYKYCQA